MKEQNQLAIAPSREMTTGDLIAATIQSGVTESTVAVVERLCALRERENALQAERDLSSAFVKLQTIMPQIVASKAVPGNDGTVRYKFAPYEEIMTKAKPALTECGFGITFDTEIADGRVTATCTLIHAGGAKLTKKFACRIGSGPPKASEAQTDGAATTYAKRFALCAALNIVVETDDDARGANTDTITPEQAESLKARCAATKSSESKFLAFADAESFDTILASNYAKLDDVLSKREKAKPRESTEDLRNKPDLF